MTVYSREGTMSVTSSMWTGVSGLLAHGEKMNVIGNNIANVNTIGFKSQRMDFSDLMYVDQYNNGGLNQVGHGTQVQTIITSFTQGAYESTTNPTDLAINGSGFFQVRQPGTDQMYYTRAGNFTFDKEGNLEDPNNYILQGWKIENTGGIIRATGGLSADAGDNQSAILGTGSPQDVKLDAWTVQPFATTYMDFIPNLSMDKGSDNSPNNTNPFAGLMERWDGTQPPATEDTPPIPMEGYSYQTTMDVYDEAGVTHKVTVYYDKIDSNSYEGGENGGTMWEYIVTMDPAEDKRQFWNVDPNHPAGGELIDMSSTKNAGILAAGTISFDSAGQASNQSCYTFLGDSTPESDPSSFAEVWDQASGEFKFVPTMNTNGYVPDPANPGGYQTDALGNYITSDVQVTSPEDLEMWQAAEVSANGYPVVVANFTGILDAQTSGSTKGDDYGIELNFGLKASNIDSPWSPANGSLADLTVPAYTFNEAHNPDEARTGPDYFLLNNDDTSATVYDSSVARTINSALDNAQNAWDAEGFTRTDGGGNTIPFTFSDYINGVATIADISGSSAFPAGVAGNAALAQADSVTATDFISAANLPIVDQSAFEYILTPATAGDRDALLAQIYNESNGTNIDLSVYSAATPANATELSTYTKPVVKEDNSIQSNAGESATYSQSQNGYGFGNLSSYYVDERGVLAGVYSNGVTMELYQIVMYDFTSTQNLKREGGNVYSQTLESGDPKSGPAGVAGLGTISSGTIEQSNVDLAREFVLMITTQRGYQGNSKVITTADTMLETVIGLVR